MAAKTIAPTIKTTASPKTNGTLNTNGVLTASDALKTNGAALAQFPEFPLRYDMQNIDILHEIGYVATLKRHFGRRDTTLVYGELPVGTALSIRLGLRIPDLIIAFDCDPARAIERQGYDIDEQGKPPDFVLEIASKTTGRVDYTDKRIDYERYGIPEYWRFDATGGDYHDAALAGDRLADGRYEPIPVERDGDSYYWGYSDTLGLYVCWDAGKLRWYDPRTDSYLLTSDEEADRADRAEESAAREAAARQLADERAAREAAERRRETLARRQADERAASEAAERRREAAARRQADERAEQEAIARRQAAERAEQETLARQLADERADRAEAELRRLQERMRRRGDDE